MNARQIGFRRVNNIRLTLAYKVAKFEGGQREERGREIQMSDSAIEHTYEF